jgi:hypothetical protein
LCCNAIGVSDCRRDQMPHAALRGTTWILGRPHHLLATRSTPRLVRPRRDTAIPPHADAQSPAPPWMAAHLRLMRYLRPVPAAWTSPGVLMNSIAQRRAAPPLWRQPMLPGVPAGTCMPSQLHGVHVRYAIHAHCCSGVNGPGPAHGGVPGVPHIGSAEAMGMPAKVQAPTKRANAVSAERRRMRFMANSDL